MQSRRGSLDPLGSLHHSFNLPLLNKLPGFWGDKMGEVIASFGWNAIKQRQGLNAARCHLHASAAMGGLPENA